MKRIELKHKNQCNGEIDDGFIAYELLESHGNIHDFFVQNVMVSKIRGELSENTIMLEDTSE